MELSKYWDYAVTGQWEENTETDTEYKVTDKKNGKGIAFQGSSDLWDKTKKDFKIDWKQNFDFLPKKMANGIFVHRGFYNKMMSVYDEIIPHLSKDERVEITGFSQGGDETVMLYAKLKLEGYDVHAVGFACSRCFLWCSWGLLWYRIKHKESLFANLTRIEVIGDIITRIPPVLFGYRHAGSRIRLADTSNYKWWQFYKKHMIMGRLVRGIDLLEGR